MFAHSIVFRPVGVTKIAISFDEDGCLCGRAKYCASRKHFDREQWSSGQASKARKDAFCTWAHR